MDQIDEQLNRRSEENRQLAGGLSCHNPSLACQIVRLGQEAMARLRRGWNDWLAIGEALQVGQTASMQAAHTNKPTGRRYEKIMTEWLVANGFKEIDKGTRSRLLECLDIEVKLRSGGHVLRVQSNFVLIIPTRCCASGKRPRSFLIRTRSRA